jgi:hypothetical protein
MTALIGKSYPVRVAFLIAAWPPIVVAAQTPVQVNILNFQLTCDPKQCRTPVLEIHERTGSDVNYIEYIFPAHPESCRRETNAENGCPEEGLHIDPELRQDEPGTQRCAHYPLPGQIKKNDVNVTSHCGCSHHSVAYRPTLT